MRQWVIIGIAGLTLIALIIGGIMMAKRWVSSIALHTAIVKPAPHIECVTATSVDGIAIDCNWSEKQKEESVK